jgi:mono/diheme cytochrome c family protein
MFETLSSRTTVVMRRLHKVSTLGVILACSGWLAVGCSATEGDASSEAEVNGDKTEYFTCEDSFRGKFGVLPKNAMLPNGAKMPKEGTPEYAALMEGRCTWIQDPAGTERLYRQLTLKSHGLFDLLLFLDTNPNKYRGSEKHKDDKVLARAQRPTEIGTVNEPGCRQADKADENGLYLDTCPHDPLATGIVGIRKLPNPKFKREAWSVEKYIEDRTIEPPYLIAATCGSCHVAYNPLHPPANIAEPKWENLDAHIGNQYIHEGRFFGWTLPDGDFRKQVMETQERGTSDTSRIANDHINNPNSINAVFNLGARPAFEETMNNGSKAKVPRILKDGADSVGVELAMLRVSTNIGMCSEQWLAKHDGLTGDRDQEPLLIETLKRECKEYPVMQKKMANQALFLSAAKPFKLPKEHLADDATIGRGAKAFAKACATCHSSKQPEGKGPFHEDTGSWDLSDEEIAAWFMKRVVDAGGKADPAFLDDNYLGDDERYPVTYLGTNAARALASNALPGHIWADFSSKTYKELKHKPGVIEFDNPLDRSEPIKFALGKFDEYRTPYYRTPALTSIWTSAPFLHNNALGKYNGETSIKGRLDAFNDAATKLLWPSTRTKIIKKTDRDTVMSLPNWPDLNVKKGTMVNLFAHLDPRSMTTKLAVAGIALGSNIGEGVTSKTELTQILNQSQAPDLVEDKGHYFGTDLDKSMTRRLSEEERKDLIEYLKTL